MRAYFDGLVQDLTTEEGRQGCLLVNSAIELGATDEEVAAVVRGQHARLESNFTHALQNAVYAAILSCDPLHNPAVRTLRCLVDREVSPAYTEPRSAQ